MRSGKGGHGEQGWTTSLARRMSWWKTAAGVGALLLGVSGSDAAASGPTPISSCSEQAVQSALSAGGSYVFASNCTVQLTAELHSGATTSISSGGHAVTLDQTSATNNPTAASRVLEVTGGNLNLTGVTLTGGEVSQPFGGNGTDGQSGTSGSNGGTGQAGGDGHAGMSAPASPQDAPVMGGCVLIHAGATVTLSKDNVTSCTAQGGESANGGNGGSGGGGGAGGGGENPQSGAGGSGGPGGNGGGGGAGGQGGVGGDSFGGGIYNAGTLILSSTHFSKDSAAGGAAGWGGDGGFGGSGGSGGSGGAGSASQTTSAGDPGGNGAAGGDALGPGGNGGNGGDGGNAQGGAVYDTGTLIITGTTRFAGDKAVGGAAGLGAPGGPGGFGGPGGNGGPGGCGQPDNQGHTACAGDGAGADGGNGSSGGNAGNAGFGGKGQGGAIFYAPGARGDVAPSADFSGNRAVAGAACFGAKPINHQDCLTDLTGGKGSGGSGGSPGGSAGANGASNGTEGNDGGPGTASGPNTQGAPSPTAVSVALKLSPTTITAGGRLKSVATATVTDDGHPVSGQHVVLKSSDPGETISKVADLGNGSYVARITASHRVGHATITATDASAASHPSATAKLIQGAPTIRASVKPTTILANGKATATVTARVRGVRRESVPGERLTITARGVSVGAVTDKGGGVYTAKLTASHSPGTVTIKVTDVSVSPSVSTTTTLRLKAPPKHHRG